MGYGGNKGAVNYQQLYNSMKIQFDNKCEELKHCEDEIIERTARRCAKIASMNGSVVTLSAINEEFKLAKGV